MTDRIASHPDDPSAPLADRLLLALGMWPEYVDELGTEEVIAAAAQIRSNAHRLPMASEDYGSMAERWEALKEELDRRIAIPSPSEDDRILVSIREFMRSLENDDDV